MTARAASIVAIAGAGLIVLAACARAPQAPEPTGIGLYGTYCAGCHGDHAKGGSALPDGKLPPDLTTLARRHGGIYPAIYVMSTIDGYARERTHGPMPIFGALIDSPIETWTAPDGTLTPTPRALMLLNDYLSGLQEV